MLYYSQSYSVSVLLPSSPIQRQTRFGIAPVPFVRLRCEAAPTRLGPTERAESLGIVLAVRANYTGATALLSNDGITARSPDIIFLSNTRTKSTNLVIPKYNFFSQEYLRR